MSNAELNRRLAFFADNELPYSDRVWRLLAEAWEQGYEAHTRGEQRHNPYQSVFGWMAAPEPAPEGKADA